MMDDATLHYLIQEEMDFYNGLEKRRAKAIENHEFYDVLEHYEHLQNMSLQHYCALVSEKYRRECEQK